ncbi:hypothetical protein IVB30_11725 [Bradyrhizobium sp. 200]|uniref:hypothetical protein n=1 Tax=Bradyrhizobium sp. 200 TaxID=2782665 RepID=UPI001FFF9386|nr:hypothetical protein [Bradyrhizobium sp. 200]UPJ51951.1 hypothetical protein IVB30_11725 [Bradyrhizobium sp. 200]
MADNLPRLQERLALGLLIPLHMVVCCLSLIRLADFERPIAFHPAAFHLFYDPARLHIAVAVVAGFALISLLFLVARFSFGFIAGFYFYTMVLGYLWLSCFSDLNYDRLSAGLSAVVSIVAFLLPALFITSPIRHVYALSTTAFDRALIAILALTGATVAAAATYNFRLVPIEDIYEYRNKLEFPAILNYLIGIISTSLLPFAFAGFAARRAWWSACAVLVLFLLLYPITLSKLALFAPVWVVFMLLLSKLFTGRVAVVVSLTGPLVVVLGLVGLFGSKAALLLSMVNHRMVAIPSIAMDAYNDFFSRHEITYFCQLTFLKRFVSCPYQEPLSVVMSQAYGMGNLNASFFATEGVASVGLWFAPVSVFICGLVLSLANRLSAGLPPRFILVSSAVLIQVLLNVPLSTSLLTHGAAVLFLLWYITPRSLFQHEPVLRAA